MASPIVFRSTDSDAPTLSGTAGDLLTLLNGLLTIKRMFTAVSGASFVNNDAEAQSNDAGQTAFKLFQGPTVTNDEAYVGMPAKFDRAAFGFGTAGVQNAAITIVAEYWNGSAWTALSGVVDGTTKFTANGKWTWTIPTNWATTAVNGVTCYWVRWRFTAGSWTTNPLVNYITVTGWTKPFVDAANQGAFQQGGGNLIFLSINDGAGPGTARDVRPLGYETMSAIRTGTQPWPTVEAATMAWRKSSTADATTRVWMVWADDRTLYLFVQDASLANAYLIHGFGDIYSVIPSDGFRNMLVGNIAETAGALSAANSPGDAFVGLTASTQTGHHLDRAFHGFGAAVAFGKDPAIPGTQPLTLAGGNYQFPNGADGGLIVSPIYIHENTSTLRGRYRGAFFIAHAVSNVTDGDTFPGVNEYAGRTFLVVKFAGQAGSGGVLALETSDTVDTN